jgi:putative membrane protein
VVVAQWIVPPYRGGGNGCAQRSVRAIAVDGRLRQDVASGAWTIRRWDELDGVLRAGRADGMTAATGDAAAGRDRALAGMLAALLALLAWSGLRPHDRLTWLMEVLPVIVAVPAMWATRRRFPLTDILYACIFVHCCVLMLGGAYTYARVPMGFALQEWLDTARNPYDKIGHFMQGFVPALLAREVLIRGAFVRGRRMLAFLVVCVVMAVSAAYELVEWAAALSLGQGADEFLGTQGDPWDTQSDMFLALVGAVSALTLLSRRHDREIAALEARTPAA